MKITKEHKIFAGIIAALLLLFSKKSAAASGSGNANALMALSYLGSANLPRGIRNNNPGNLRMGSSNWQGMVPHNQNTDGAFEQFETYVYGVRAMTKLLMNYIYGGYNTIRSILYRYAPPADNNNTEAYVNAIVAATGISDNAYLSTDKATMQKLVTAMAYYENGQQAVDSNMFDLAWNLI